MKELKKKKVIIAMSGGIDSSVAAALLKKQGYNVVGVFMKFWAPAGATQINTDTKTDLHRYNRCCSPESEKRARQVAKKLGIPFYVFNFEKEFKKRIVDYFLKEHKKGLIPNPCVVCNKEIKFGLLLEKALKLGADYVATGHYARLRREIPNYKFQITNKFQIPNYELLKAKDKEKDQSYFLWKLNQKQLSRILFPIGDYTRKEVEGLAKKFKLPVLGAKKSVEICFIYPPKFFGKKLRRVKTTVNDFLRNYIKAKPGKIVDAKGNILGEHQGLWFYTIGQRRGLKINRSRSINRSLTSTSSRKSDFGKPFYVLDKDIKKNLLIVTQNEKDLLGKELVAKNVNWISGQEPKFPLKITAKIRYRSQSVPAIVRQLTSKTYKIIFSKPQRAITPGQSVVFYSPSQVLRGKTLGGKGQELLGGGIIK